MLNSAAPHLVPIIRFAVKTGARRSGLLNLDWRNVDIINAKVTFVETKYREDRTTRLSKKALDVLIKLDPKDSGLVFTYQGNPIESLKSSFGHAREKAGLIDVAFNDLRYIFASRLVQGELPLYEVMHMTGHKSLEIAQRYAHFAPDYQEALSGFLTVLGAI